ncbi:lysine transporter LysE [Candidatus Magnetomorum sp. HK-1]|nr:lysine transporter LysE [Candidatus Magnetomorum sp. HK-1]
MNIFPLLSIFTGSFIIALSGALMPGPLLTATISHSTSRGMIAGPLLILGHGLLELILVIALISGLAPYVNNDLFFFIVAILGAAILSWMAYGMFRDIPKLHLEWKTTDIRQEGIIIDGILLSLANPYWSIWWASIGLGYIFHAMTFGIKGVIVFFVGHILADFVWYAAISIAVSKGRSFLNDRLYRQLIAGCATFLLFFSAYFLYSALVRLF